MNDTLSSTRSSPALLAESSALPPTRQDTGGPGRSATGYVAAIGAVLLALAAMSSLPASLLPLSDGAVPVADAPAGQVFEARPSTRVNSTRPLRTGLAKGTEGHLRQVALHLSRMSGGESVGGFPGFEPPEDDEEYQRKVKDGSYTPEEANHWLKEINGLLKWIVRKNPGMSLKEILQRQGLSPAKVDHFIRVLQRTHYMADGMKGYGVQIETVEGLESLMKTLGVATWTY